MAAVPLEKESLSAKLLRVWVGRAIGDDRHRAAVRGFKQARHLLQVLASCADVVLQPQVIPFTTLRQEALLDDYIRDDLVGDRVPLGPAVRVLDYVDADRLDETAGPDLQDLVH